MKTLLNTAALLALQFIGMVLVAFGNDLGLVLLIPAFVQLVSTDPAEET